MAEAARIAEGQGAPVIDINMGCPAKKVVGGLSGSALMRDLDLALTLIDAVINAVRVPVTLKMRLGWDFDCLNAPLLAQRAEAAGIAMFTVHGRTRSQFYTGQADWHAIRSVVDAVSVPVIANGDIRDAKTARRALAQSNAAGVMIGRGAQGRPWALAEIAAELYGLTPPEIPHGAALADQVCDHYESILSFYGKDLGVRIARKHLGWYVDAAGGSVALRSRLMREKDPATVLAILPDALTRQKEAA